MIVAKIHDENLYHRLREETESLINQKNFIEPSKIKEIALINHKINARQIKMENLIKIEYDA